MYTLPIHVFILLLHICVFIKNVMFYTSKNLYHSHFVIFVISIFYSTYLLKSKNINICLVYFNFSKMFYCKAVPFCCRWMFRLFLTNVAWTSFYNTCLLADMERSFLYCFSEDFCISWLGGFLFFFPFKHRQFRKTLECSFLIQNYLDLTIYLNLIFYFFVKCLWYRKENTRKYET